MGESPVPPITHPHPLLEPSSRQEALKALSETPQRSDGRGFGKLLGQRTSARIPPGGIALHPRGKRQNFWEGVGQVARRYGRVARSPHTHAHPPRWTRYIGTTIVNIGDFGWLTRNKG